MIHSTILEALENRVKLKLMPLDVEQGYILANIEGVEFSVLPNMVKEFKWLFCLDLPISQLVHVNAKQITSIMSIIREVQRDCHVVQQINNDKFVIYSTNDRMDLEKLENDKLDYFKHRCTGITFTESNTILTDDVNSILNNTVQNLKRR